MPQESRDFGREIERSPSFCVCKNPRTSLRRDVGANEIFVVPDVVDQPILILPHLKKVVVFAEAFDGAFTIGTQSVNDIFLRPEPFVERAVPSSIVSLINQLFIVKLLKVSLNHQLMLFIGSSDEGVIGDVQPFPEVCEQWGESVAMGLRIDAGLGGGLLDLLSVLVQAGQEKHVAST